ncbi:putative lachesin, partial [Operophtera brumata]
MKRKSAQRQDFTKSGKENRSAKEKQRLTRSNRIQYFNLRRRANPQDSVIDVNCGIFVVLIATETNGNILFFRVKIAWYVGWLRAEDQMVLTMHDRTVIGARYSVNLDAPMTWQLRIRPLRAEDRGCYMCQINTQPNMKWQIGCIDVY